MRMDDHVIKQINQIDEYQSWPSLPTSIIYIFSFTVGTHNNHSLSSNVYVYLTTRYSYFLARRLKRKLKIKTRSYKVGIISV